ncbi:MAG: hypothetical protein WBW92_06145 [Rhodanobacteraceae bacterium]
MTAMAWYDWAGLIGVAVILLAFFLLQARYLQGNGTIYQLMNALGAMAIMLSLVLGNFNLPAFALEAAWLVISIYGMLVGRRIRRDG